MRTPMLTRSCLLFLLSACTTTKALDPSEAEPTTSQGSASSKASDAVSTFPPRDHAVSSSILLEHANLNDHPTVSDANFKTLVRHCLKSTDELSCDGMAQWDISRVTDCSLLFWEPTNDQNHDWILLSGAEKFNVDLSAWNTSSCTTMQSMFNGAAAFDQPIGNWNVHRVTDMSHMFQGARSFNKDIAAWRTDNVLDMQHMFKYASRFHNPNLSHWETSRVTNMAYMFASASHFNGKLNWNVARVQHFNHMFHNADLFNSFIGDWDVGGAIDDPQSNAYGFVSMFEGARDFNQDISHWDMRHALKLDFMFRDAYSFDQDLSPWSIDDVDSMQSMFLKAKSFQQTLCWDLSGKVVGRIFEETAGASAESNVSHCWSTKHANHKDADNQLGGSNNTSKEGDHKPTSLGWRMLQALLLAAAVALASYWILLARRHLSAQRDRNLLAHKVTQRACRTSRRTSAAESNESRSTYDDDEEEEKEEEAESDDESVEILFENHQDRDRLRDSTFRTSRFLPSSPAALVSRTDEVRVEHAVPAMSTLLQQHAARERDYTPRSVRRSKALPRPPSVERDLESVADDRQSGGMPEAQLEPRSKPQLVVNATEESTEDNLTWGPQVTTPSPHSTAVLPSMVSSHNDANAIHDTTTKPQKRGRLSLRKLLSKGGRIKTKDAPKYVMAGGNAVYQDADNTNGVATDCADVGNLVV